jgi:TonB family protein
MAAAAAQAQSRDQPSRRRGVRYRVQTPLDVTVLRSGIPDTLPGRSVNLGERGIAAVVAGELVQGEAVGVEIQMSLSADPLRMRALVRHHDKLRSGMEFVGLTAEQQAAIRGWVVAAKAEPELAERSGVALGPGGVLKAGGNSKTGGSGGLPPPTRRRRSRAWIFLLVSAFMLSVALWWRWNRGWDDLESGLPKSEKAAEASQPQARVPAEIMEKLITHRVDPEYPAAARRAHLQGIIALDVVVGRDGSVVVIHALNGPDVLAKAAIAALRWWRFAPYRVEGKPVVVETTVAVEFNP